jgi:hypothetical protein
VRVSTLAAILVKDSLADRPDTTVDLCQCFLCTRTFTSGKGVGLNSRFCSALCVTAYDAGYVHQESGARYTHPARGDGFLSVVRCAHKRHRTKDGRSMDGGRGGLH